MTSTEPSTRTERIFAGLRARYDDTLAYLRRPVEWVQDKVREFLWSAQRAVIESVRDNRYTVVHSAHELGKSHVASRAIAWWIDSHPPGEAFVVSTAPTAAQVSAILWREIGKAHTKAKLPGRITRAGYPMWHIGTELVGYGRKPADHEDSAFQGIHARYVLVVIDEAGGVPKQLYDAIDSIVANENSRVLAIGNPDDPGSHFAATCKPGSDWNVIHLDGLRSPNMTRERIVGPDPAHPIYPLTAALMAAEGIPYSTEAVPGNIRELLLDPLWVEERIIRWAGVPREMALDLAPDELGDMIRRRCAVSSLFQAKVRGVFPTSGSTGVIPLGWVQQAINRWHDWNDAGADLTRVPNPSRRVVGVDVAYTGNDETVIAPRYGDVITKLDRYRHADTIETADYAAAYLHEPHVMAVVDVIGIGAGTYDTLRRYKRDSVLPSTATIVPFNASAQTPRTDLIGQFKFRNDRAAAWWKFRELLDPSRGSKICIPDDERLIEELVAVQYEHLVGGVIKIESKDDIRKRLGRSTDTADAVIQAFWVDGLTFNPEPVSYDQPGRARHGAVDYSGYERVGEADMLGQPGTLTSTDLALARGDDPFAGAIGYDSGGWDT